jgi:hypothetical protein
MLYLIDGEQNKALKFASTLLRVGLVNVICDLNTSSDGLISVRKEICHGGGAAVLMNFSDKSKMCVVNSLIEKHGCYKVTCISVEE